MFLRASTEANLLRSPSICQCLLCNKSIPHSLKAQQQLAILEPMCLLDLAQDHLLPLLVCRQHGMDGCRLCLQLGELCHQVAKGWYGQGRVESLGAFSVYTFLLLVSSCRGLPA